MKIAQRFNAGMYAAPDKVPKGRLKEGKDRFTVGRPFEARIQINALVCHGSFVFRVSVFLRISSFVIRN